MIKILSKTSTLEYSLKQNKTKGFAKVDPVYLSRTGEKVGLLCFNRGSSIICSQTHIGGTFVLGRFRNIKWKIPSSI